ncbi:polynucleotide 5'-hydroxyl-kinase NOL9 [Nymphalis io]|uniref:polynucleotide 5'-hydroxyl-kinase NOL9 n=1 Tax=Inachis io TaxID=171585 RepID=UPI0021683CE3|nr:polynucleotide 5'-hydroxyl-kinase NOL9 [Nymphalis io]
MEFFEKAHIMKSDESKSKKSTENVKKQLKQMLYGYKVSDNKLIQNAGNVKNDFDDSTSVSGFSDLNLTNSSHEDDTTHAETTANDESSLTDLSENLSSANVLSDNNHTPNHENEFDENTISESNENIESFSEVIIDEEDVSSLNDSNISIISGILESSPESENSDVFDADGNLAAEILKKLELMNVKKLKHKRKYSEVDNDDYMILYKNQMKEEVFSETETSDRDNVLSTSSDEIETNNYFGANPKSPQFVSITATDMQNQSLDEILGEYKYSTIRNITSENFNTASSTNNSGIFTEDTMNVDIQTEDDVCSLIPEVDDIPPPEEIDKEFENLEISHTQESINNLDNTLLSELASDTELVITEDAVNLEETFKLYYTRNSCIVTLKHPSELFIQGKVKIKALFGKVEVFGYTLKDDTCNVYAPYYNFAQFIKTVEHSSAYYGLFGKLTSSGLSATEAEDIVTSIGHQDGVIVLQTLDEVTMDFVDSNFKATNLFVKPNKMIEPYFIKASDILNCSLFSARPWKSFEIHPVWKEANGHAQNQLSRGIVCGGAGVGKSTYLRYQVNKLLDNGPVLVVDLDPGQCEFTVAGNISATIVTSPLFGPSFTHLKKPEIMLNIGMINTMDNAKRYVSAVHSLITHCSNNETLANMRWIINTMGMTNVLGQKFITLIITLSKPTYLIQYESKSNKKRFESFLRPHNVKLMYEDYKNDYLFADSSYPNDLNYSFVLANDTERSFKGKFSLRPKDERYLNFVAYFSQLINIQKNILGIVPYQVHLKDLYIGTNVIIKEDCVTKVINGKIVALCQQAQQCVTANPKVFTLSDKPLRCYGHGLIRGVDWEKGILYVITPVPSKELGSVDTLVYADWVPELVGQEIQLPKGTVVPYRTITQDHNKQLMSTPRRRFNPLQLLKMARSS